MNEQIAKDISNWSQERIVQWFNDSVDRYMMADLSVQEANCRTVATLMQTLAIVLAQSKTTPEACAWKLMEAIRNVRKLEREGRDAMTSAMR
jgi:t-SNARE complex subunit (syntaxin)